MITGDEPAFPESCTADGYNPNVFSGITIRQQFAKDFMVAMLTNPALLESVTYDEVRGNNFAEIVSKKAIEWTDIFIKELNNT